ncbi:hypothetical protein EII17_06470 [Clostridiales bacterium COT073_COT-073]|nr:hypothetical protein EII17_06470 [Clostridiales bacterium COT073_COT-073]
MLKIILLWQVKQRIVYRGLAAKLSIGVFVVLLTGLLTAFWINQSNAVRVYVVMEESSPLAEAFLNIKSQRIIIEETDLERGLSGLRQYQAEALIIIPKGASEKILSGQTQNIFELYYLHGNQLAPFLADRIISDVFAQIYDLAGNRQLTELYQKYRKHALAERKRSYQQRVAELEKDMTTGRYFLISEIWPNQLERIPARESKLRDGQGKMAELGILITAAGINFIFLLYFGLKLLSERNKNDRIKLAGFYSWHMLASDALILLLPQLLLFLVLLVPAWMYGALSFWIKLLLIGLISLVFNLLLIRTVKEKQIYFPVAIGVYMLGIVISLGVIWNR